MSAADPVPENPRKRIPVRLLLFGLVAVAAFALGFLVFNVNQSRILVRRFGYYTIAATFAWWVFAGLRVLRSRWSDWQTLPRREVGQCLAVIGACTAVAVMTTPLNYKILYDEMVLQATASNMHQFREVSTVMRAYTVDGVFVPLDSYLDKRPFFYAFLVSLVHDLTGYREFNGFAVNIGLIPVILAQVYWIARRYAGHRGGLVAALALGTLSTFAHSGMGAGMEMLNLAMILLLVQVGVLYLEKPDEDRLSFLLLSVVLLAQTRYESSLYVAPVALIALEGWRRAGRMILPVAAVLAPALLIPYGVHNTYLSGTPMLWELHENAQARFGLGNLGTNLEHAVAFFFNTTGSLTNSVWLSVAGLGGAVLALSTVPGRVRAWRTASSSSVAITAVSLAIVGNLALLMAYYWGQLDDATVSRLSLPFAALLALAIAYGVGRLVERRRWIPWVAAGGSIGAYLWSGLIANAQHTELNTLGHEIEWERRYVAQLPPGERLIVTNKSALPWMISRIPAIAIEHARRRVEALQFQLANHTFRDVLVFQRYRPTGAAGEFQLDPADRLPDWFVLEPVTEKRFGTRIDRLSRLTAITPPPPEAKR